MSEVERDSGEWAAASAEGEPPREEESAAPNAVRITARCAGRTAVGQVRDHNEDNFVVANLGTGQIRPRDQLFDDEVNDRGLLFAVCDGMGGAAAGEVASQMAVDILVEALRRGGPPKNRDALARRLVSGVEEAGKRIFEAAQKERSRRGMGTTATVAVLVDKVLFLAEVGDSRAYLLRRGQLKQLTKDQSLVNQLIEAGHLTEDEAEAFEHSNIILQALGTSETVQVDLTFVELRRGDRLMMCSDGLSGLVHNDMLRTTLAEIADPADCCAKLIEYAETAGGHDNITVVVADFDGPDLAESVEGDGFGYVQYPLPLADGESSAFVDEDTTSAGTAERGSRSSMRSGSLPSAPPEAEDHGDSLLPLSGETPDGRTNALWLVTGAAALALAGFVWWRLEPYAQSRSEAADAPKATVEAPAPAAGAAAAPEEASEVEVTIHTDAPLSTLLVNGEVRGDLSAEQSRNLKLRPGPYRFEARREGSPGAVSVVTVRGDTPMDVFLQVPKSAEDQAGGAAPPPEGPDAREAQKPPADEPAVAKKADPSTEPRPRKRAPEGEEPKATDAQKPETTTKPDAQATTTTPSSSQPGATPPAAPSEPAPPKPKRERAPVVATPSQPPPTESAPTKPPDIPDNPF